MNLLSSQLSAGSRRDELLDNSIAESAMKACRPGAPPGKGLAYNHSLNKQEDQIQNDNQ
jgi:hypothetical protein